MPDPQGTCQFGGLQFYGGDVTLSRGVAPAVFRLREPPEIFLPPIVGALVLNYGGATLVFPNCATAAYVQRIWKGRIPYAWSNLVYDRRWMWRWPRISGEYNLRRPDGTVETASQASLTTLLTKCLEQLGEIANTLTNIPNVFPYVNWDQAYAARELEWLCDLAGLAICPKVFAGVLIEPLGTGNQLPGPAPSVNISPVYSYQPAVIPSKVVIYTGGTLFQSLLDIGEAVGLDTDGTIKPLDDLSYKPTNGWNTQWYTTFADVDAANRHLAFATVWRWYRLRVGSVSGVTIDSIRQYKLSNSLAEQHDDSLGMGRSLDPIVSGTFWNLSDLKTNVTGKYTGRFTIRPALHLVEFEYPVIQWTDDKPAPADLDLYTSYQLTDANGGLSGERYERAVPQAVTSTPPRVERRRHLQRTRVIDPAYGQTGSDNQAAIQAEADAYLIPLAGSYAGSAVDMLYGGFVDIPLTGQVAQVMYRWGNERVATTRASQNTEFDTSTASHQERRRRERLGQIADLVLP